MLMPITTGQKCWSCGRDNGGQSSACRWCGVWLIELRSDAVPSAVRSLLPLARRWGISDDGYRDAAVAEADLRRWPRWWLPWMPSTTRHCTTGWLDRKPAPPPSAEYVAVTALTMAADQARHNLRS